MATMKTIRYCENQIQKLGIRDVKTGRLVKISFAFFGIESQVDEPQFMKLSKAEQRRHRREDSMLLSVYGKRGTRMIVFADLDVIEP